MSNEAEKKAPQKPARKSAGAREIDLESVLPSLREQVRQKGLLKTADVKKAGVPAAQVAPALARLEAEGFEAIKAGVRIPLRSQITSLLADRQIVPVSQLGKLLRGGTPKDVKAATAGLLAEGGAQFVLRGAVEALCAPHIPTLSRERLESLVRATKRLQSAGAKALKKKGLTLLAEDVREPLLEFGAAPRPAGRAEPAPVRAASVEDVRAALRGAVRPGLGLAFLPDAVRALEPRDLSFIHATLLSLAAAGEIELQPESGLNRLSGEELACCPPGPQGTRLSWARLTESAA